MCSETIAFDLNVTGHHLQFVIQVAQIQVLLTHVSTGVITTADASKHTVFLESPYNLVVRLMFINVQFIVVWQ